MINKITESQVQAKYVKGVSGNRLTGTVEQNKDTFDKLPELIVSFYNALIDTLQSSVDGDSGADSITITQIDGISGTTVQAVLESFKGLIDDVYTKTATDEKLDLKANQSTVDGTIKNVTLNDENGKLTFEKVDGSTFAIDTLLEKIITNFEYDPSTQTIKFTASDGTVSSVNIAEFVTVNEFLSSNQIEFSVSDGVVTATVKNGSITESMLNSALLTKLEGYASSASQSATNAAASASNASDYAYNAAESALSASGSAASADTAKTGAESARATAEENSTLAKSYAVGQTGKRDGEDTDNSKYYKEQAVLAKEAAELARDEAKEIAGGDYVTNATFTAHTGNSDIHVTADEKTIWNDICKKMQIKNIDGTCDKVYITTPLGGDIVLSYNAEDDKIYFGDYGKSSCLSINYSDGAIEINSDPTTDMSIVTLNYLNGVLDEFSAKPITSIYTMKASNWSNSVYSFDSEYPKDTYDIEISLSSTATDEQGEAFDGAMMLGVDGTNTVKCRGTVPTIDIPVVVRAVKK